MENVQDLFFVATNGTWNCSDIGHECPNVLSEASGLSPGYGSKTVFVAAKTFVVRSLSDLWGQFVLLVKLHVQFHLDWFGNLNDLWCDTQLVRNIQWTTDLIISLTPSCEFFLSVSVEVLNQEMSRTCSAHPEVNLVFDSLLQILFCKRCCVCFWRETSLNMCRVTMKTHSVLFGSVLFGPLTAVLSHVVIDYFGCVSTLLWALLSVSVLLLTIKLNWISIICCFNSSTLLLWCLNE